MIEVDTCDACGPSVRAWVYIEMHSGPLTLCGHHATRFEDQITLQGGKITHDFRYIMRGEEQHG